ncbi:MAG: hypothetical protein KF688_17135 [Pirellulales bacterium]|nr:hypothetical protein [Pirellulales bacterium]
MKSPSCFALILVASLTGAPLRSAGATIEFASAAMGAPGVRGGQTIGVGQFVAWRFTVTGNMLATEVGGHLALPLAGELFAAIVRLESVTALPPEPPFATSAVVGSALVAAAYPSEETFAPLSASLTPGAYALVFGAGQFGPAGTTWGTGAMVQAADQPLIAPTTPSSFLLWIASTSEWRTNVGSNMRFVVRGKAYGGPGDFDFDGAIDGADLAVWQTHYGETDLSTAAQGDATGDGAVDGGDFLTWQRGFSAAASGAVLAAPEPAAFALGALCAAGATAVRGRGSLARGRRA